MTWRHAITTVRSRGKVRYSCCCGGQSGWLTDQTEIDFWPIKHTGLKEQDPKKRKR